VKADQFGRCACLQLRRFARMKSVAIGTVTNISGVGDDAYYSTLKTRNTTDTTLNVKKGVAAVVIRVFGG